MFFSIGNRTSYIDEKSGKPVDRNYFYLRFINRFGFMASSLSQLVVDLKQVGLDKFKSVSLEFGSDAELMNKEGINPYSFMDEYAEFDVDPLTSTNSDFRNDSTGESITECYYEFSRKICERFNIKTLG